MFKFVCIFVCAFAAVSASPYGRPEGHAKTQIGGYAYQVQPAVIAKALVPAGGSYNAPKNYGSNHGSNYGSNHGSNYGSKHGSNYGSHSARLVEVPIAQVFTKNQAYGHGPAPVDHQALDLAKLSLTLPNAGRPLIWKEAKQHVIVENYASHAKPNYAHERHAKPSYAHESHESHAKPSYAHESHESYAKPSYAHESHERHAKPSYAEQAHDASAAAASSSVSGQKSSY